MLPVLETRACPRCGGTGKVVLGRFSPGVPVPEGTPLKGTFTYRDRLYRFVGRCRLCNWTGHVTDEVWKQHTVGTKEIVATHEGWAPRCGSYGERNPGDEPESY